MQSPYYSGYYLKIVMASLAMLLFACKENLKQKDDTSSKFSDIIVLKANRLQSDGELKQAMHYIDSAFSELENPTLVDLWKKYAFKANHYLNYQLQPQKAKLYVDSMHLMLAGNENKYVELITSTIFVHADLLMVQKRYNEAFQYYYEGRSFAKQKLDNCDYSIFSHHLGIVRYRQGQYAKAIPYIKQALLDRGDCKTDFYSKVAEPQSFLNTAGLCYEKLRKLDSAIVYYQKALILLEDNEAKYPKDISFSEAARGVVLGNLGGVYSKKNQPILAERYLKESIQINDRPGYEVADAITARIKLADFFIKNKRYPEAKVELALIKKRISWNEKQNRPMDHLKGQWYLLQWNYAEKVSNLGQAYQYSKKYYQLRDSIELVNEGMQQADMDEAFKIKEQQHQLSLLDRDNKVKKTSLIALMMLGALTLIIVFIVWRNLLKSKKNIAELTYLNEKVRQQNKELQKVLSDLEQSQTENTRMMKIAAHDLRNPIEGIASVAGMMLEEQRSEQDEVMLELINKASKNSLELVNNLLQVHSGERELKKDNIDIGELLQYCVDLLTHKAIAKKQVLHLTKINLKVLANREKLWRVMSNLITNAIKFSEEGKEIWIEAKLDRDKLVVSVKDEGIGIPNSMNTKVFDIFTEAKRQGTMGEQSFGLGLAISKQIMDLHDGNIWFETEIGSGTTFFISLPIE